MEINAQQETAANTYYDENIEVNEMDRGCITHWKYGKRKTEFSMIPDRKMT
jgi:hypothetical protein